MSGAAQQVENATTRRQRRERDNYGEIYTYMQSQLAYLKRKVAKAAKGTQTELGIKCTAVLDEDCLGDVVRLLVEEGSKTADGEYRLQNCLLRSTKVLGILNEISEKAERILGDPNGEYVTSNPGEKIEELTYEISELHTMHSRVMRKLEEKYKCDQKTALETAAAALRVDFEAKVKHYENAWKSKETRLLSEFSTQQAAAEVERNRQNAIISRLKKEVENLENDLEELKTLLDVNKGFLASMKREHIEHDLNEKERGVEFSARIAMSVGAVASSLELNQQKIREVEAQHAQFTSRMKAAYSSREATLLSALTATQKKYDSLREDHSTVLRLYAGICKTTGDKLCRLPRVPSPPPPRVTPTPPHPRSPSRVIFIPPTETPNLTTSITVQPGVYRLRKG